MSKKGDTTVQKEEKSNDTRVEILLKSIKNNRFISLIIIIGIVIIAFAKFAESAKQLFGFFKSDVKEIADVPKQIRPIVSGKPTSLSKAEIADSAVQLFENGWMLVRFSDQTLFAIQRLDNGAIKWTKTKSGFIKGQTINTDSMPGVQLLKLGFRWWYTNSEKVRKMLGKPITEETRAWIQFQTWDKGLLVYGLPSAKYDYPDSTYFQELSALWFEGNQDASEGQGKFVLVSDAGFDGYTECSSNWYSAKKDGTYPEILLESIKAGRCLNPRPPAYYVNGGSKVLMY